MQKGRNSKLAEDVYNPINERGELGYQLADGNEKSQVYEKDGSAIVALRGTDPTSPSDLTNDLAIATGLVKWTNRYKDDKKTVQDAIDKYGKDNVLVVGHSLGGKLAKEISRDLNVRAKTYNKGASITDFVQGGLDHLACKVNPNGKRCSKAKLSTHYRTRNDPVSLLGATSVNTKLVKKYFYLNRHDVRNFKGRGKISRN